LEHYLYEIDKEEGSLSSMNEIPANSYSPVWWPNHSYWPGERIISLNGVVIVAVAAGISGSTPPIWPDFPGATINDGTVIWMYDQIPQPVIDYNPNADTIEIKYNPNTGDVMGDGCKAKETMPVYEPPLIEEREV
jgi:hypothetical protein